MVMGVPKKRAFGCRCMSSCLGFISVVPLMAVLLSSLLPVKVMLVFSVSLQMLPKSAALNCFFLSFSSFAVLRAPAKYFMSSPFCEILMRMESAAASGVEILSAAAFKCSPFMVSSLHDSVAFPSSIPFRMASKCCLQLYG